MKSDPTKDQLIFFAWLAIAWGCVCTVFAFAHAGISAGLWTALVWVIASLDLLATSRVVQGLLNYYGGAEANIEQKSARVFQTGFWTGAKLLSLGILGFLLFVINRQIPFLSLMLGTSVLVVVPIIGGYFWSRKSLALGGSA